MIIDRRKFLLSLPALAVVAKALPSPAVTGVDLASGPDLQVVYMGQFHDSFLYEVRKEQLDLVVEAMRVPPNLLKEAFPRSTVEEFRFYSGRLVRLPPRP